MGPKYLSESNPARVGNSLVLTSSVSKQKSNMTVEDGNLTRRKKGSQNTYTVLAIEFFDYLLSQPEQLKQAGFRDGVHTVFQRYYDSCEHKSVLSKGKSSFFVEGVVMARLRERRLIKSIKIQNSNRIQVLYAMNGIRGNFQPELIDEDQAISYGANRIIPSSGPIDQVNMVPNNSTLSSVPSVAIEFVDGPPLYQKVDSGTGVQHTLPIGTKCQFELSICLDESNEDIANKHFILERLQLVGPGSRFYSLDYDHFQLPMMLNQSRELLTVQFGIKSPKNVGVFRAFLEFLISVQTIEGKNVSEYATIKRSLKVNTTHDLELDAFLRPSAPFVRKARKPRLRKHWTNRNKKSVRRNMMEEREDIGPPPLVSSVGNVFKSLPFHSIPPDTIDLILAGELDTTLDRSFLDSENDNSSGPERENAWLSHNYSEFWKNILWAYEFQLAADIEFYDMDNARLEREGDFFKLLVPGLAEARPSVLRGDLIEFHWKGKIYKGRVQSIRELEVLIDTSRGFRSSFDVSLDSIDIVRFTVARTVFRILHENLVPAEASTMKERMLLPSQNDIDEIGNSSRHSVPTTFQWASHDLNSEQKAAVERIVHGSLRPLPYIIFGPPGTGKTTTVIESIYQLVKYGNNKMKILVTAPSNDAVDVLTERLSTYFPPSELTRIIAYNRSIETVRSSIRRYVCEDINSTEAQRDCILNARIVVTTLNLASRFSFWGVHRGHFDVMVVDEAGQAIEPELISAASSLMDFYRAEAKVSVGQLILTGDPKQLGPIVTSGLCQKFQLDVSYMERLMRRSIYKKGAFGNYPENLITKLVKNYRSHPSIIKLPNKMFYDDELECKADRMVSHSMERWEHLPIKGFPVIFHAVAGENLRESNSPSWFNPQEIELSVDYVRLLIRDSRPPVQPEEIGIVTPYARQAQKIQRVLELQNFKGVKVGSVETFQGQERRCIIISTVRSKPDMIASDIKYNLGFVSNEKRFNVAMTRAKALLIVIGCPQVLELDKQSWLPFLEYCHENKSWLGEEWEPFSPENDVDHDDAREEEEWDLIPDEFAAPSPAVEQGGFPSVSLEE